jgi:type IV pilus assembly protein PilC
MAAIIENTTLPLAPASGERQQIRFNYTGTDVLDNEVSFYIWATDEVAAVTALERAKINVDEIRAQTQRLTRRRKRISREQLGNFAIQLSERTRASEQIRQAVGDIARASNNRLLREALFDVSAELKREGAHAADAFRKRPDVFPDAFSHIMQVSMKSGDPSDMLKEYGETQLRTAENISRLKGALYYPAVIIALASIVICVLTFFVLPAMEQMYSALLEATGGQLPFLTRMLLGFSRFLVSLPGIVSLALFTGLMIYAVKWLKGPTGSELIARKSLHWPLVGKLLRDFHSAYTVHLIAILASVVTPNEFLKEAASASLNIIYREKLEAIRESFRKGGLDLTTAFAPYAFLFGDEFQPALATGEKTGRLDTQLGNYAKLLDRRVQDSISKMSKLVVPLTLVVAGLVIGLIVVAAYLPLFTLVGELANKK